MALVDFRDTVGRNRPQLSRDVQIPVVIDFATKNLASGDSALFAKTPKGFVYVGSDTVGLTAEGGTATVDIGTVADPDGMLDGGNVDGTGAIARAGTETLAAGTPLSETELYLKANNALDAAKVLVVVRGYTCDDIA